MPADLLKPGPLGQSHTRPMPTSPLAVLGLGFVLGMRHALDVDHLAAVSTLISQRRGLRKASLIGALWGLGHTVSLGMVAIAVIGLHYEISPTAARGLEMGVALMLIGLGANLLRTLRHGGQLHVHTHDHDGHVHSHLHIHPQAHAMGSPDRHAAHHGIGGGRSFLVGMTHGLAGSAALMLAVLATIPSPTLGIVYVTVFGMGSLTGMLAMSAMVSVPLTVATRRSTSSERAVRACAALVSVGVGMRMAWAIGVEAGVWL